MKIYQKLLYINFGLLFGGFLIVTQIPNLLGINPQYITMPYRALSVLISIVVLAIGFSHNRQMSLTVEQKVAVGFWIAYLLRMFFDLHVADTQIAFQYDNKSEYWMYALGVGLIPAVSFVYLGVRTERLFLIYYVGLTLGVILAHVASIYSGDGLLAYRRVGANESVQAILYGNMGAVLALLSLVGRSHCFAVWWNAAAFAMGVAAILRSGARGAAVSFILVVCFHYFSLARGSSRVALRVVGWLFAVVFVACLGWPLVVWGLEFVSPVMLDRVLVTLQGGSEALNGRDVLVRQAVVDFLENPWIGKHFVLDSTFGEGYYPHNSIAEAFMALGVVGGAAYLWLLTRAVRCVVSLYDIHAEQMWIGMVFMQNVLYSMSSMALYKHQGMWVFMMMLFALTRSLPLRASAHFVLKRRANVVAGLQRVPIGGSRASRGVKR